MNAASAAPGPCRGNVAAWADFVYETDEIVMVVEGDVEFEIAGETHRPRPGEELLIPAGASHTVRNYSRTESRWLYGYRR